MRTVNTLNGNEIGSEEGGLRANGLVVPLPTPESHSGVDTVTEASAMEATEPQPA